MSIESVLLMLSLSTVGTNDASSLPVAAFMTERTFPEVEFEYVRIERFAAIGETQAHSHCRRVSFLNLRDGFFATSRAIDPLVTPAIQVRDDAVFASGQDQRAYYDGTTQVVFEDVPESQEDILRIDSAPDFLRDADPRRFGLFSLVAGAYDEIRKIADDRYGVFVAEKQDAVVTVDPNSGLATHIEVVSCSGVTVAEWDFSEYDWVDVHGSSLLVPCRAELRKYGKEGKVPVYESIWMLADLHAAPETTVAALLRQLRIPSAAIVLDDRFVPRVSYYAGLRHGPDVSFSDLSTAALERLRHADDETAAKGDETPSEVASVPVSHAQGRRSSKYVATVSVIGLLWIAGRSLARRRQARRAVFAAMGLLAAFDVPANAESARAPEPNIEASMSEIDFGSIGLHESLRTDVTLHNRGATPEELVLDSSAEWLAVMPRRLTLAPGASRRVVVQLGLPAGEAEMQATVDLRNAATSSTIQSLPVTVRLRSVEPTVAEPELPANTIPPRLLAESTSHEIGEMFDGDKVTVRYPFTNQATEPLVVRNVHAECGCTVAKVTPETIEPGAQAALEVTFAPEGRVGHVSRKIHVITNDPNYIDSVFEIHADVLPGVSVGPSRIDLGTVRPNEQREVELTIDVARGDAEISGVRGQGLEIAYWAMTRESATRIRVTTLVEFGRTEGPTTGTIRIAIQGRKFELSAEVHAEVHDRVWSVPSQLGFPFIDVRKTEQFAAEFAVRTDEGGEISEFTFDPALITVARVDPRDGEVGRFRVGIAQGAVTGYFESTVVVHLKDFDLRVPVRGFVSDREGKAVLSAK